MVLIPFIKFGFLQYINRIFIYFIGPYVLLCKLCLYPLSILLHEARIDKAIKSYENE